ncbi:MAG: tetratricopeptide repeat protein [Candidatus Margulisiibacteriota bacterium]
MIKKLVGVFVFILLLLPSFSIAETLDEAEDFINKGDDFLSELNIREANYYYNQAVKIAPKNDRAWCGKGETLFYFYPSKYETALTYIDKAIRLNPKNSHALLVKGDILNYTNQATEASAYYNKVLKLSLDDSDYMGWVDRGTALLKFKKYDEAIKCFDKAISINPHKTNAYSNKAFILVQQNKIDETISLLNDAESKNPDDYKILYLKANILANLNKYNESMISTDKALRLNPNHEGLWILKGNINELLGKYANAVESYNNALIINPKNAYTWELKANAYLYIQKYKEAIKSFDEVIKLSPPDSIAALKAKQKRDYLEKLIQK